MQMHLSGEALPAREFDLLAHGRHRALELAPLRALYVPPGQSLQVLMPAAALKVPGLQRLQL